MKQPSDRNKLDLKRIILASILTISLSNLQSPVWAADGDLDTSFDTDGKLTTPIGSGDDYVNSVVVQSDGKIVVAGDSYNGSNEDFAVLRYNSDGSLDTTFGTGGKVTTPIGSSYDFANSVVLQSDGKIVVAGSSSNGSNYDFAIVRYNTDGSLDTTFDTDGKLTTLIGSGSDVAYSVVLQSDGKIVAAGYSDNGTNNDFAIIRYNTNGSLDTTFDTDGKQTTAIGSFAEFAYSVVLQSDGKIVVAGSSHNGTNHDFAIVRYNTDGSLDTTFDTDGKVTTSIGSGSEAARSVVLQSDGKIVAAGYSDNGTNNDFAIIRYNTNGSLDTTFDTDGKLTTPIGSGSESADEVVLQSDGKIVAAGFLDNGSNDDFAVLRYNSDGSLDTTFGTGGKVTTPIGSSYDFASSVVLQSDGKIVVAGSSENLDRNYDFAVVRYSANVSGGAPSSNDSGSTIASVTTPTTVKTADVVFNLKNKKYLSKNAMKTKLSKNKSFKRNPKDLYKYSIFGTSKKTCLMRGNYVMALKKTGSCDLYAIRTTSKGAKYKYWVKINYVK